MNLIEEKNELSVFHSEKNKRGKRYGMNTARAHGQVDVGFRRSLRTQNLSFKDYLSTLRYHKAAAHGKKKKNTLRHISLFSMSMSFDHFFL